jgi:D-alanine transaminase
VKNLGYYNGKIGLIEEMTVPMCDRAGYFGDGIYDATYSRNHIIYTADAHIDRFFNSARLVGMEVPMSKRKNHTVKCGFRHYVINQSMTCSTTKCSG